MIIEPDIEIAPNTVDMRFRNPVCPGVFRVGVTERYVDSGNLLVLQNIANHMGASCVCADSEFTHAIAIFVDAGVGTKLFQKLTIRALQIADHVVLHRDRQGMIL